MYTAQVWSYRLPEQMLGLGMRKGYIRRLLLTDPVDRPAMTRTVVRFPDVSADPTVRPELSRNVVRLPDWVAEPCVRPDESRNVARSPLWLPIPEYNYSFSPRSPVLRVRHFSSILPVTTEINPQPTKSHRFY